MLVCRDMLEGSKQIYQLVEDSLNEEGYVILTFDILQSFSTHNYIEFNLGVFDNIGGATAKPFRIPNNGYSDATIKSIKYALKPLLIYETVNGKKDDKIFNEKETEELINFMAGIDFIGEGIKYCFTVKRNISTVKDYFVKLIRYGGIKTVYNDGDDISELYNAIEKIYSQKPRDYINAPKDFITPNEYERLNEYAGGSDNPCYGIIMKLLYQYGMRIGEILGLTCEDIKKERKEPSYTQLFQKNSDSNNEEDDVRFTYEIWIRNRGSDKIYQHAQSLIREETMADGKTKRKYSKDFDIIFINEEFYEEILHYIGIISDRMKEGNYRKHIIADTKQNNEDYRNFYIMLDLTAKNGKLRLLSLDAWNSFLIEAFNNCSIKYDFKMKKTLSKVVRNGYGRFHAIFSDSPKEPEELCRMMRYSKVSQVLKYYSEIETEKELEYEFESGDAERRISKYIYDNRFDVSDISKPQFKVLEKIDQAIQKRLGRVEKLKKEIKECDITIATIAEDTSMSKQTYYNNDIYKGFVETYKKEYEELKKE